MHIRHGSTLGLERQHNYRSYQNNNITDVINIVHGEDLLVFYQDSVMGFIWQVVIGNNCCHPRDRLCS